jgi:hypothetical protein
VTAYARRLKEPAKEEGDGVDPHLPNRQRRAPLLRPLRDPAGRNRSRTFSVHKDAQAFKLDIERRHQSGLLYQAPPERFGDIAQAWLERFVIGAAGRVRPRPKTIRAAEDCLRYLAPLNELALERVRRPLVEDLLAGIATHAPRRAEMALSRCSSGS